MFDIDHESSKSRRSAEKRQFDRLESEEANFHERVRQGFLSLAEGGGERYRVIDASQSIEDVSAQLEQLITELLAKREADGIRIAKQADEVV